jgi:hypothetical protein
MPHPTRVSVAAAQRMTGLFLALGGLGSGNMAGTDLREHRTSNVEHRTSNVEHRTSNIEHPTSNIEHRTSNIEHRTSNVEGKRERLMNDD